MHKSKYHQYRHLIRLCRRRALADLEAGGNGGTAYRLYLSLVDKIGKRFPAPKYGRHECTTSRAKMEMSFRRQGWRMGIVGP